MDILTYHFVANTPNGFDVFWVFRIIAYFSAQIADVHINRAIFGVVTDAIDGIKNHFAWKDFALIAE